MKEIPLTQGMITLVDDEDYEGLMKWKWHYHQGYAAKSIREQNKSRVILMHRVILNTPPEYQTDHINGNGLDNRKKNLRVATPSQNRCNKGKQLNNTSGFKGVCWCKRRGKWEARLKLKGKYTHLGCFKDKLKAAQAYNDAAIEYHGEFAHLNRIGG